MTGSRRVVALKFLSDVIQAQPGYWVVEAYLTSAGTVCESLRTPVIAWALERGSFQPYPITVDGIQQGNISILLPSGSVKCIRRDSGESITYSSHGKWLEAKYSYCEEKD